MAFFDRVDAGRRLASKLEHLRGLDLVVLGLPRGGVPVAFEIAKALGAPLDVIVVRKLGVPFQPELGMGAIGEDGVRIINQSVMRMARVSEEDLERVERLERDELNRRARRFRRDRSRLSLVDKTAVVVDDGIATGSTAQAACQVAREHGAARVVMAVPVAPRDWTAKLADAADELICVETPEPFWAIGQFYADFSQTTDEEVIACLEQAAEPFTPAPSAVAPRDEDVEVVAGRARLAGRLTVPPDARGVVIFAHGSGSSRHSPRNRFVANVLNQANLGTLLFDLLTTAEERDRSNVFDIELLAERLVDVTHWLRTEGEIGDLPVGYFGASTGAGAALWAAAEPGSDVAAVVSRGGRPDLAMPKLELVTSPTLLIVGGRDEIVLELNREALEALRCERQLEIVPGATHLFEEAGTLERAAELARDWFLAHAGAGGELIHHS